MNRALRRRFAALLTGLALGACAAQAFAGDSDDFALGSNAEAQTCRAVARFDAPKGTQAADIYCGAWERPSGRVVLYASDSAAAPALQAVCAGDATALRSPEFSELRQIACARTGQSGPRRYAMVARRGQQMVIGDVFPSDWAPLISAARVLTGAAPKSKAAAATGAGTPGLAEIQAVFPSGPPGQGAAANYELLRRRAYEYNLMWSFGASQRDFQELLRAHAAIAPDDADGEAELLAEIGLNMSSARRFDEAAETLNEAQLKAKAANDGLLLTKITNYQAIDQLNQRRYAEALRLALAANQARANLARANEAGGGRITAGDVGRVENQPSTFSQRSLLLSLTSFTSADKAAILSAQADYIAGVACKGLGRAGEAVSYLDAASALLAGAKGPPAWLVADIAGERSELKAAAGDYGGAVAAAQGGLALIKTIAPGTRSEAHLWLSLEAGQAGLGQTDAALTSGRAAISIFANQSESPGLPPDIAA